MQRSEVYLLLAFIVILIGIGLYHYLNGALPEETQEDLYTPSSTTSTTSTNRFRYSDFAEGWKHVGTYNQVKTYTKSIPGSKLLAFRGVTVIDVHISHALGPFINITHSLEWVSMLKSIEALPVTKELHPYLYQIRQEKILAGKDKYALDDISYQTLSFPWPIQDRDVLLSRQFDFNELNKTITVQYHSIEDDRKPHRKEFIRAVSPHTMWKFTAVHTPTIQEYDHWQESLKHQDKVVNKERDRLVPNHSTTVVTRPSLAFHKMLQSILTSLPNKVISFWRSLLGKLKDGSKKKSKSHTEASVIIPHHHHRATDSAQHEEQLKHKNPHPHSRHASFDDISVKPIQRITPYTLIEIETIVDSKGSIPAWFINYMQM